MKKKEMAAVKMGKFSLFLHTIPIMTVPVLSLQVVPKVDPGDPNQLNIPCGYLSKELWMPVLLIKQDGMEHPNIINMYSWQGSGRNSHF